MHIVNYFGKFHPLAVHLPIGILVLFVIAGIVIPRKDLLSARPMVRLMLLVSAFSATISVISGFILTLSGDYAGSILNTHRIFGIVLTLVNWIIFFRLQQALNLTDLQFKALMICILVLITITGHLGGSLTHGEDYLSPPPPSVWFSDESEINQRISLNSSGFEAVSVIFNEKCVVCHGPGKQKGGLRLDSQSHLEKGGKNGNLIGEAHLESLLITRITLPPDDEEHMPPKDRKQLSKTEIDFLIWWVTAGAAMDRSLQDLGLPDSLFGILTSEDLEISLIPEEEVKEADQEVLQRLAHFGVIVTPVGQGTNYLAANFVNVLSENISGTVKALSGISPQLIHLYLDDQTLSDADWQNLSFLVNLRKLSVRGSNLNDSNIIVLSNLQHLKTLNLVRTDVSAAGIRQLRELDKLEQLYLYQTRVRSDDFNDIKNQFPRTSIDTGNYIVPILESDTTVFTL